jgi:glycosyltransferase involved in cell wall biosynthesis
MIRLSIVIITFNEERNLARCLDSVKEIADEIVVVDSFSTDNTAAIAGRYNAKVIQHPFIGYGQQKNFATQQATNDWILSLDADETLTPELQQSIREVKMNPDFSVYEMSRLTNYCGKWIKYCGWYPDKQTRLYNRTKGKWEEPKVHEYWRLDNEKEEGGTLKGDILHYSFRNINEHLKKIEKYSELAARESVDEYFLQLGFLDGFYGYTICRLSVYATFLKYSKIRLYYKQKVSAEARALRNANSQ